MRKLLATPFEERKKPGMLQPLQLPRLLRRSLRSFRRILEAAHLGVACHVLALLLLALLNTCLQGHFCVSQSHLVLFKLLFDLNEFRDCASVADLLTLNLSQGNRQQLLGSNKLAVLAC